MEPVLTLEELIPLVVEWGRDKGILEKSNPLKQLTKTIEEATELMIADLNDDREEMVDAVGDVLVTLILYCEMKGIDILKLEDSGFDDSYNYSVINSSGAFFCPLNASRLGALEKGYEFPTIGRDGIIVYTLSLLETYCEVKGLPTLPECLQSAYNVIAKRTGKMVDGVFVKDN